MLIFQNKILRGQKLTRYLYYPLISIDTSAYKYNITVAGNKAKKLFLLFQNSNLKFIFLKCCPGLYALTLYFTSIDIDVRSYAQANAPVQLHMSMLLITSLHVLLILFLQKVYHNDHQPEVLPVFYTDSP